MKQNSTNQNNLKAEIIMREQNFLVGDLETGGLNERLDNGKLGMEHYPIFEIAIIVTNNNLAQIGEPLVLTIHQSEKEINKSDKWAIETHTKSGLLDRVRASTLTLAQAEETIMKHLESLDIYPYDRDRKTGAILAGNSIMFDRTFLLCQMPKLHKYLHYRQLDISAIALAARAWNPELEKKITAAKKYKHEALADIQDSIEELRQYRELFLPG
jgi:oligoribonuclease (3'-5' exoribonuclease)